MSWPVILANLTIPMVGTVDTAVMGRMPDASHIGAVALGATAFTAMYWMFGFLRMSTTGLLAQAYGAGKTNESVSIACRALCVAITLGLSLVALQAPLRWLAFEVIFAGSSEVESLATGYFDIRIFSAPATLIYTVAMGVLFGLQQMRATLVLGIALNISNLLLDLLFVVGFDWGVRGVALGTLISEWGAAFAGIALAVGALRKTGHAVHWPKPLWPGNSAHALFSVSSDLIVRTFFVQAPFLMYTALGASLGNVLLAANAILLQLFFIAIYAMDGFAHTVESLSGHAYGRADAHRFQQAAAYTTLWAGILAITFSLMFGLAGSSLVSMLTNLPEVQLTAQQYLPWLVAAPLLSVWAFQLDGIFIGITKTKLLRNAMFFSFGLFLAALGLAFPSWGNHGLWLAMMVFMVARGVLLARHYPRVLKTFPSV